MRPNRKRRSWIPPLVIRSLSVLAITIMAMTTAATSSASVPECSKCPPWAHAKCVFDCQYYDGQACVPRMVIPRCMGCYKWKCTSGTWNRCSTEPGGPVDGQRVLCVLDPNAPL